LVSDDFTANTDKELTISKGQKVEIIESTPAGLSSDWCLVRLVNLEESTTGLDGLIPVTCIRQLSNSGISNCNERLDNDESGMASITEGASSVSLSSNNSNSSNSPANKRRSSFRKWFANPVRKLSQGKIDKGEKSPVEPPTPKGGKGGKTSKFNSPFKTGSHRKEAPPLATQEDLPSEERVETPESAETQQSKPGTRDSGLHDNDLEEEITVEMPPPMEEIKTHTLPPSQSEEDRDSAHPSQDESAADADQSTQDAIGENSVDTSTDPPDDKPPDDNALDQLSEEESNREKYKKKREYVITELIETERDYVRDLGLIVEGYMQMIQSGEKLMPEDMVGKDRIVFGNIHQIFDWHRETFHPEIEKCKEEPERVGGLFVRYENRLLMYVKYCENKPKSEYIVAEYIDYFEELRRELGHKLQLPDLLIKPVQRIMKYQLLLKDILKYTDRMGDDTKSLQRAVQVMCVVPKAANDMMNVGRLQGFDGKITAQGKLLLQDTLMVQEHNPKAPKGDQQKFKERRVFLFEQIIIFSEETEKKKNNLSNPGYIYKNSLMVNKMELDDKSTNDPLTFALIDKTPRSDLHLICQAPSDQVKQNWASQIRAILEMQKDFLAALTNPRKYVEAKDPSK